MSLNTGTNGLFYQERVGLYGRKFYIYKVRTMKNIKNLNSVVTTSSDPRLTAVGKIMRMLKIDELPQLFNVLIGDMSMVGPRPEVEYYVNKIPISQRSKILSMRPGITGPASIKYKNEEVILARQKDPEKFNLEVIFPDKIKINIDYLNNWSFFKDLYYIVRTII
tara:strand:- start:125 stop:619 length:495 start_codon:yes stop_codon:yes gene_type:complete